MRTSPGGRRAAPRLEPALDTVAEIETPEHIRFEYRVAGPARRAAAYGVDLIIRFGIMLGVAFFLALTAAGTGYLEDSTPGVFLLVMFAMEWGYYVLLETMMNGQTPGKKAFRLRTVKEGGYPINFVDVLLRNLLRAADFLPGFYAVGVAVMSGDRRFRRLGDMVAGTMVVVEDRLRVGSQLRITPTPTPAELASVPAHPMLSADEIDALELYLRRLGMLSPSREAELAELVAPVFADRMGLRPPQSPGRFLALLYHRATARAAAGAKR